MKRLNLKKFKPKRISFRTRLTIIFTLLIWVVALNTAFLFDAKTNQIIKTTLGNRLLSITKTAALMIDGDKHSLLKTRQDEETSVYREIRAKLQSVRDANFGVRYIYTARIKNEKMIFVVDAEEAVDENKDGIIDAEEDTSHIGDVYDQPPEDYPEFIAASQGKPTANTKFVTDQWGTWISAATPIYNNKGEIEAVLGVDMSVEEVLAIQKALKRGLAVLYLLISFPLGFLISGFISRRMTRSIQELEKGATRIAQGDYTKPVPSIKSKDEIGSLAKAFNVMRKKVMGERNRLAREIHDGLSQELTAVALQTELCQELLDKAESERVKRELAEMRKVLVTSSQEVRRLIFELRTPEFLRKEFVPILRQYLGRFSKKTKINCQLTTQLKEELPLNWEMNLYKIIIEALNNIKNHAQAKNISLQLNQQDKELILIIEDDGRGFDLREVLLKAEEAEHYGLSGLKERARLLGGDLTIETTPGKGTKIIARIPYRREV